MAINQRSRFSLLAAIGLLAIVVPFLVLWNRPDWTDYGLSKLKEITPHVTDTHGDVEVVEDNTATTAPAPLDEYVAVCVAIKDQGRDLPEFLQHHHYNMGINRFYLMDDGSNPPLSSLTDTYGVPSDILTFVYYNATQHVDAQQLRAYNDAIAMFGKSHTWMAFIDADEFFDTPGPETLHDILKGLEPLTHIGALGVNWQMHTSNNVSTRPESVRKAFTECITDNNPDGGTDNVHIKSIVRTTSYKHPENPHKFSLNDGAVTVGEYGDVVTTEAFRQPITRDRVSLHHYVIKSREEYEEKMNRHSGMGNAKGWEFWTHVEVDMPHVQCTQMLRWVGE